MKIIQVTSVENFASKIIPKQSQKNKQIVESILKKVQQEGDLAIKKYEKKFSGAKLGSLRLSKNEIENAYKKVSKQEIAAIKLAKSRLEKTESIVKSILKNKKINTDGINILKRFVPLQSTGCYIPGGLAKYPSSVVMSVIPARVAGVKRIVVVSPPNSNGKIDPWKNRSINYCCCKYLRSK
jgi:histidinol dehydrogenase